MLASLIALLIPPRCLACDVPTSAGVRVCAVCRAEMPWLARPAAASAIEEAAASSWWAPVAFDGPARALVHALKFGGRVAAADVMAAQIAANAPPGLFADGVLVPAPGEPGRVRLRGFDHADVLARRLAVRTGLPVRAVLVRAGAGRQVGAGRSQRLRGDLGIRARRPLSGRAIVVDDVCTTGATLAVCARELAAVGAQPVIGVAYARALG